MIPANESRINNFRTYAFALLGHVERSETSRGLLRFAQNDSKRVSPKLYKNRPLTRTRLKNRFRSEMSAFRAKNPNPDEEAQAYF